MRVSLFSTSTVLVHSGFSTGPPPPPGPGRDPHRSAQTWGCPCKAPWNHRHGAPSPTTTTQTGGPDHRAGRPIWRCLHCRLATRALNAGQCCPSAGARTKTLLPVRASRRRRIPPSNQDPRPSVSNKRTPARTQTQTQPGGRGMEAIVRASRGGIQDAVPVCVRSSKPSQQREGVPPP